jgi:hypothetical protein
MNAAFNLALKIHDETRHLTGLPNGATILAYSHSRNICFYTIDGIERLLLNGTSYRLPPEEYPNGIALVTRLGSVANSIYKRQVPILEATLAEFNDL